MYRTIKHNHNNTNKVFWVSDLHFGHDRSFILEPRGYKTVDEHDRGIIDKWNSVVSNNDIVFNLGDIIFGHDSYNRLLNLLNRLNFGTMYLSGGNHTSGFKELPDTWTNGNKFVYKMPNLYNVSVNKQHVVNCHFPIASWDGMYHGAWHVCGHEHGHYTASRPETLDQGKILDVGIELFGRPIDFDEMKRVMDNKKQVAVGHH